MKETIAGHYARTLAHLRPSQIFWRAVYRAEHTLPGFVAGMPYARVRHNVFPTFPPARLPPPASQPWKVEDVQAAERGIFRFLNQERFLGRHALDWQLGRARQHRLWIANLHYHEWLYRLAEASISGEHFGPQAWRLFNTCLSDWIRQCPLRARGSRELAWSPYVIATRLGWWARAYWLLQGRGQSLSPELEKAMLHRAYQQARFLEDHLEWDTLGNHLIRDAVGLAWASRFLNCPDAPRWTHCAARLMLAQAPHQFLADGGHYERSPMYHAITTFDVLLAYALLPDAPLKERLTTIIQKGIEWLAWMCHPDGDIALLNDAALGLAPPLERLRETASMLAIPCDETRPQGFRFFPETGIVAWHGKPWTIFFDIGPVGPDEQPGHGHADTLSLECSLNGHRVFVDTGVGHYDPGPERNHMRSTKAHNTVSVDGENSSEVWGLFRIGRRSRILSTNTYATEGGFIAEAEHDGYRFIFGSPRHHRRIELLADHTLSIADRILGRGEHTIEGSLLLAPEWRAEATTGGWIVRGPGGLIRVLVTGLPTPAMESQPAPYYPTFGIRHQATRLVWRIHTTLPANFTVTLTP